MLLIRHVCLLFMFFNTFEFAEAETIQYEHIKNTFANRCSACHNSHMASRNGRLNWNKETVANSSKVLIKHFVVDSEMMPKKWSDKFNKWPEQERVLFQGWLDSRTFEDVGLSEGESVESEITWPVVEDSEAKQIFEKLNCQKCLSLYPKILNRATSGRAGDEMYWSVYYLGDSSMSDEDRKQYLAWSTDDLIRVASWLSVRAGTEVSYQWIKVRSRLGR